MSPSARRQILSLCGLLTGALLGTRGAWAQPPSTSSTSVTVDPGGATAQVSVDGRGPSAYHPSRAMVRFRAGTSFLPGSGNSQVLSNADNLHLVQNPRGLSVAEVVARYRANPNVVYAEPDYVVNAIATPNDPEYLNAANKQWDMAKISAPLAWDLHTISNVIVAVVDTGIDYTHEDLLANLYTDGMTPPIHGYTCMGGSCVPGGQDDHGHGTHVAGTIGAATNNGIGIAGINWSVKLLSIKFLSSGGSGSTSDAVLGFNLLKTLKQSGLAIRVTNNSWGGGGYSQALKDAMAALEDTPGYPSTVNVCAAGNSGVNADFTPMYPAAFDNRGIVSVLATDINDAGAGFSNFGLQTVDIAAPGVSTYSTEMRGLCSLCDPTGYRYLSGTSMASPHVAGVAAALLSMNPALTAAQARDALLHPNSYDPMSGKAQNTSSGGRLNFYKTITNAPYVSGPVPALNNFPIVTVGPDVYTTAGGTINFTTTASDPDVGDSLRMLTGGSVSVGSTWLFGWELNQIFPSIVPGLAPAIARTAAMEYDTSVADNRGGGASGRNWAVVAPVAPGGAPTGTLTVPATGSVGVPVTITFSAADPQGLPIGWDLWAAGHGSSSGWCCFTGSSVNITFNTEGVYRIGVQAIDRELLTSPRYNSVITIGTATGSSPVAAASLDKESGPVPLTVNIDMSGSSGTISYYYMGCGGGVTSGSGTSTGSCTFTSPGTYWMLLQVQDSGGNMDLVSKYAVVTPATPSDTTPPTVTITNPTAGANVSGTVNLEASASDNAGGSGVKEVEYYLDSTAGSSLGKATVAPYTVPWNSTGSVGAHAILSIARDMMGNASAPVSVNVNVNVVNPAVTLATPTNGQQLPRKSNVRMSSNVTPGTYNVARVDYLANGNVVCSGTASSSYACNWKTPAAQKTYTIQAKAYDINGNSGSSSTITVTVK